MVAPTDILRTSRNLRIITEGDKALLYDSFYGQALVSHQDMLEIVEVLKPGISEAQLAARYPLANLESCIKKLKEKGLIVEFGYPEPNRPYRVYPADVINSGALINKLRLNVAMTCNMKCAYCYVDSADNISGEKVMAWPTAKKALEIFFNLQKKHDYEKCVIRFFGGEPLLNWPIISQCLDYIKKISNGIAVDYILNTNGTVFSKSMAQKLADHQVGIAVSIDGIAKEHDRFRKLKNGQGTFHAVLTNLEMFLGCGCVVGVEATVGDHNIFGLEKLVLLIADLQDKYETSIPLSFQHLSIVDKTKLDTTKSHLKVDQLLNLLDFADRHGVRADTGLVHFPFNALKKERSCGAYCRAIGGEMCIYPDGGVYPCGALPVKLGTIDNIKAVFKSDKYHQLVDRVAGNITSCKDCEIEAFCAGGCTADVFSADKAINGHAKNCTVEKKLFRQLVKRLLLSLPKQFEGR